MARLAAAVAAAIALISSRAPAEPSDDPSETVVVVRISATSLADGRVGEPVSASATGWFVDGDGRIITAHHIFDMLGKHDVDSHRVEILMTPGDTHPESARVLDEDAAHDLLLLKIGRTPADRGWLRFRGLADSPPPQTSLCYTGFPRGRPASQARCGALVSSSGSSYQGFEYVWDTTLDSAEGLSGSPVYLKDCPGVAVGIVKGKDAAFGSSGLVIPSRYLRLFDDLTPDETPCDAGVADRMPDPPVSFPLVRATSLASRKIVKEDARLRLVQMEPYGPLSGYIRRYDNGDLPSYQLDPYHGQRVGHLPGGPNPVFNVIIENRSDESVVLTSVLYQVSSVTQYKGGQTGPLIPDARYQHAILWKAGDQIAPLAPGYQIAPHSVGSFLLQIVSADKDIGLAWTMRLWFLAGEDQGVRTGEFELVMSK